jgi:hypothetical protein
MVSPTHFTYWVGGRPPRPPRIGALADVHGVPGHSHIIVPFVHDFQHLEARCNEKLDIWTKVSESVNALIFFRAYVIIALIQNRKLAFISFLLPPFYLCENDKRIPHPFRLFS